MNKFVIYLFTNVERMIIMSVKGVMNVEMQEIVTLIQNTGVTVVILGYFIYRDYKFMGTLKDTLTTLVNTINTLKEVVQAKGGD